MALSRWWGFNITDASWNKVEMHMFDFLARCLFRVWTKIEPFH